MGIPALILVLLCQAAADDKATIDEAIKRFNKAFANPNASARATAVLELSKTPHDRTLRNLIPLLNADVSDVRAAAAKGLAEFGDWKKIVTPSLQGAMQSNAKDYKVQSAILETLGKMADPLALSTVHGNLKDPDTRVAKAAILACGTMRQKESMDVILDLEKDIQKWLKNQQSGPYRDEKGQQGDANACKARLEDLQKAIIKACQDITKERWATAKEWEIWWDKHKANFEIPK